MKSLNVVLDMACLMPCFSLLSFCKSGQMLFKALVLFEVLWVK